MIFLHTQVDSIPNLDPKIHFVEKKVLKKYFFIIFLKEAFKATVQKCSFACKFEQKMIFFKKLKSMSKHLKNFFGKWNPP